MVFFNCNACGEALKKNQVEKHTMKCRNCQALSCVDCGKDFWGNDYQTHTKCISEEQKYCGKGYVPKVNKGEAKQEQWIEKVQEAIENSTSNPKLKSLLERLKDYPNIPRKKVKFENFIKNSLRINSDVLISQVWDTLMASAGQGNGLQNGKDNTKKTITESLSHKVSKDNEQANHVLVLNEHNKKDGKQKSKHEGSEDVSEKKKSKKRKHAEEEKEVQDEIIEKTGKSAKQEKSDIQEQQESNVDVHKLSKRERKEERRKNANKKEKKDKNENCINEDKKQKKRKFSEIEESEVIEKTEKKKSDSLENNGTCDKSGNTESVCDGTSGNEEILEPKKMKSKKVKFNWQATILTVLKAKGEISLKKLQKKVLNEFAAQDAANYSEDNLKSKFQQKVSKMTQVQVFKDRVKLK